MGRFKDRVSLVENEGANRLRWPLGIVTQVFPVRDGVVWSAEVKTAIGKFIRSIQKLHDLELIQDDTLPSVNKVVNDPVEKQNSDKFVQSSTEGTSALNGVSPKSRFGRIIKHVKRLDMCMHVYIFQ